MLAFLLGILLFHVQYLVSLVHQASIVLIGHDSKQPHIQYCITTAAYLADIISYQIVRLYGILYSKTTCDLLLHIGVVCCVSSNKEGQNHKHITPHHKI